MTDPLNRVVSPLGDRLQKQKEAIARFEHREKLIKTALASNVTGDDATWTLETIESILNGEWDNQGQA